MAEKKATKATQEFVPIKEIRDGIIILKDGSMRAIVIASSQNFALKSVDEQNAIIYQFQNFLNSLDFSVEIFIESRRLDIRPYVALLEEREKLQTLDLMRLQIKEYIRFVQKMIEDQNIMTKYFFVVVPYTPPVLDVSGAFKKKTNKNKAQVENAKDFEEHRTQLERRLGVVIQGLGGAGVRGYPLGTEELIEVFYKLFNPGDVEKPIPTV